MSVNISFSQFSGNSKISKFDKALNQAGCTNEDIEKKSAAMIIRASLKFK